MAALNEAPLALNKTLAGGGPPVSTPASETKQQLDVAVVVTSIPRTIEALKTAAALAARLSARITLIAAQVVPYPLPLNSPPVLLDFSERRFRTMAEQCSVETRVQIYLCRDRDVALEAALERHSIIVLGAEKRWWPTRDSRLARRLKRCGHEVITVEAR